MKQWLDDFVHELYFEKEYRNYHQRGGGIIFIKWLVGLPLLLLWFIRKYRKK